MKRIRANARPLAVKVKTAKGRKISSTRWLQRQLNDPYVLKAKSIGYKSRAAFKLIEIDERFNLLKSGMTVIDLGCSPGGWSQVALEKVRSKGEKNTINSLGRVVGIDLNEPEAIPGLEFHKINFLEIDPIDLIDKLKINNVDVVLSDMASSSSGHKKTDHLRIMALCESAACFAERVLKPGGVFLAKVLAGGAEPELQKSLKIKFEKVINFKPPASRKDSSEKYVVAIGFRA
tara:strand:- start:1223 stop:1921 length:699 start_codon:yes stop_codon:yes gene_type:complete